MEPFERPPSTVGRASSAQREEDEEEQDDEEISYVLTEDDASQVADRKESVSEMRYSLLSQNSVQKPRMKESTSSLTGFAGHPRQEGSEFAFSPMLRVPPKKIRDSQEKGAVAVPTPGVPGQQVGLFDGKPMWSWGEVKKSSDSRESKRSISRSNFSNTSQTLNELSYTSVFDMKLR